MTYVAAAVPKVVLGYHKDSGTVASAVAAAFEWQSFVVVTYGHGAHLTAQSSKDVASCWVNLKKYQN